MSLLKTESTSYFYSPVQHAWCIASAWLHFSGIGFPDPALFLRNSSSGPGLTLCFLNLFLWPTLLLLLYSQDPLPILQLRGPYTHTSTQMGRVLSSTRLQGQPLSFCKTE